MTPPAAQARRRQPAGTEPLPLPAGLDDLDAAIINRLQDGLPLTPRPFAEAARWLDCTEEELLLRLERLLNAGFATRLGPLIHAEAAGGAYMLAALAAPETRFEAVAEIVNGFAEVAHNYARAHHFNMWFVLAAPSEQRIAEVVAAIEAQTGLPVLQLPKEAEYFVDFRVRLGHACKGIPMPAESSSAPTKQHKPVMLEDADRRLLAAMQAGLPVRADAWTAVGRQAGMGGAEVLARVRRLHRAGIIRRVALVPNHFRLGYRANGMTVWDVEDARIDALARRVAALPFVSHCYRRPRRQGWPYNLFAMVHGHDEEEMQAQVRQVAGVLGTAARGHAALRSTRILKKTGVRLF